MNITSSSNPLIKDIRRAVRRGEATEGGLAVAESPHLLEEAARSGIRVEATLLAASAGTSASINRRLAVRGGFSAGASSGKAGMTRIWGVSFGPTRQAGGFR